MKFSPLNFHLSIIVIKKWLAELVTPRVGESTTPQLSELTTPQLGELLREKKSIEIVFSHTMVVFSPLKFMKKDIFCPKMYVEFFEILSLKRLDP